MKIVLKEEQLQYIVEELESESEDQIITIRNSNLLEFYKDVKNKTRNKRIDLGSIKVHLDAKGESFIIYRISSESNPVMIVIPYSEEIDKGSCPSCEKIKSLNPKAKLIKSGTFGKNRKFEVYAIPQVKVGVKKYSRQAVDMLKSARAEDFKSQVYDDHCPNATYPSIKDRRRCGGALTVGYGTLVANYPELAIYKKGTKKHLSKSTAEQYIRKHLDNKVVPKIKELIWAPLNQNEFDALCVLLYNIGAPGVNLTAAINSGNPKEIKKWWSAYKYDNGEIMGGLVKRRAEELLLFFK